MKVVCTLSRLSFYIKEVVTLVRSGTFVLNMSARVDSTTSDVGMYGITSNDFHEKIPWALIVPMVILQIMRPENFRVLSPELIDERS